MLRMYSIGSQDDWAQRFMNCEDFTLVSEVTKTEVHKCHLAFI